MSEAHEPAAAAPRGRWLIPVVILLLLISLTHVWIISAGWWTTWPPYGDKYRLLADGFLRGQLSLPLIPPPQLAKLADPYDPVANEPFRYHDVLYYNGKFYIYWGPVPALLIAAVVRITGLDHSSWGDQRLVFLFTLGTLVISVVFICRIRQKWFASLRPMAAWPAIVSLGLGAPLLYALARPAVYEAAIMGGQFFILAGLCAAWLGLSREKARTIWLIIAGTSWALAVGSRLSLAPAVVAVAALTACQARGKSTLAALLIPLCTTAFLLGWYNFARFGSVTDFGMRYQLSGNNQHAPGWKFSSLSYLLPNLLRYATQPFHCSGTFPYLTAAANAPGVDAPFTLPSDFNFEELVGLIWTQPYLILAPLAFRGSRDAESRWLTRVFCTAAILGFLPAAMQHGSTMRFLLDAVPCLTLLAAIGYMNLMSHLAARPRISLAVQGGVWIIVAMQAGVGLLLGTTGYWNQFATNNPQLFAAMQSFFPKF